MNVAAALQFDMHLLQIKHLLGGSGLKYGVGSAGELLAIRRQAPLG